MIGGEIDQDAAGAPSPRPAANRAGGPQSWARAGAGTGCRSVGRGADLSRSAAPIGVDDARSHYLRWARAGRAARWRYLLVLVLVVLAWALGTLLVAVPVLGDAWPSGPAGHLAVMTASFALGWVSVPLLVRLVLRRPAWSVVTGWWPGPLRHVGLGAAVTVGAAGVVDLLVTPFAPLRLAPFGPGIWLPLAAVALVGFFVQAGFEELLFRGLLMQAFASRTMRAGVVIGVPAIAFAVPHWGNLVPFTGTPLQLTPYVLMGLTFGWAAWYSGSLWLPFGMHWANNMYAAVTISTAGDVLPSGAPLVRDLAAMPLEVFVVLTAVQCAIQVIAVRRLVPRVRPRADPPGWHSCAPSASRC